MVIKKFWKPSVTTQFTICPIPFHMDTYRGCVYNCTYCFARDFTTFARRNSEHKEFSYLVGNRADLFEKWIKRTIAKDYDYKKSEEVAFKERIPIKIGATSDPFPPMEKEYRVTADILKVLHKIDYPVEIQTKNPAGLLEIADEFDNPNWTIAVTIITTDAGFAKVCEPYAPTPVKRLGDIKKLTSKGLKVMVKIQPAIYPKILEDLPDLIKSVKEAGCWAFNTEGLKVRIAMPKCEQEIMQKIGDYFGMNIRELYRKEHKTGSDWELRVEKKMEYTQLASKLAKKYGLTYYPSDNENTCISCGNGGECCGTKMLRNYKIWANNTRSKNFKIPSYASKEFGKCIVNFCRGSKHRDKTINQVMEVINQENERRNNQTTLV